MKKWGFVYVLMLVTTLFSCNAKNGTATATPPVNYSNSLLVDVRTPEEFAAGSVPGAINIPLSEVSNRIQEFKTDKPIVVFCRSGNRSEQAKSILESNGIKNVTNGGSWQQVKEKL